MDAFALLRASSSPGASKKKAKHAPSSKTSGKRARSSSPLTPSSASQGSRFVECPLCGKSVHSSLAQAHVERCTPAQGEISPPPTAAVTCSPAGLDPGLVAASSVTSARQEEAGGTGSGETSTETPASPASPAQAPPAAEPTTSTAAASPTTPSSTAVRSARKTPAQANAFSTLMAASALSNFREEMYLWAHEDGKFSWGWGPVGNPLPPPPSAATISSSTATPTSATNGGGNTKSAPSGPGSWSCQVATKGPDGRKAGTCDLWTNLPPANPAAGSENAVSLEGTTVPGGCLGKKELAWEAGHS